MNDETLSRLRPVDGSPAAIHAALAAVRTEQAAAMQRAADAAECRTALLLTGTTAAIRDAEEAIRTAELDALQCLAIEVALKGKLVAASATEAGERRAAQVRDAAAKVEAFNVWFIRKHTKHAAALAVGLELEHAAIRAREGLRSDGVIPDLPPLVRAHVGSDARGLGFLTRLPAAEAGTEPFWWPGRG